MNIVKLVNRQAQVRPDAPALVRGSQNIRFRGLAAAVHNLASHLSAQGIAPGDRVGIAIAHSPFHVILILALARLRAISLPVHALHPAETRKAIVDHFKPVTVIARRDQDRIEGCSLLLVDPDWVKKPAEATLPSIMDEDIGDKAWRIYLSSGTTGVPKGVVRTHNFVLTQTLFQASVITCDPKTRFISAMDVNTGASLLRTLRYLTMGSTVVFPQSTGWDGIAAVLADGQPTHTLVSPSHISRWLRELGDRRVAATALTYVGVSGGRLPTALRQRLAEHITSHAFCTYGSTEAGSVALQYPDDPQHEPDSIGRVVPWAEAQVVDAEDRPLPPGEQGRLRFRGYGVATAYYENPEASAKSFRNGWFYPGDLGRISRRGSLFIEAREDETLNVRGLKLMPGETESILAAHPAVAEAAAFRAANASGEEFLIAAVVKRSEIDSKELLNYCREKLGPRAPHRIISVSELPHDAMGKVIRSELARNFRSLRSE